jgi:hypothetical protein
VNVVMVRSPVLKVERAERRICFILPVGTSFF